MKTVQRDHCITSRRVHEVGHDGAGQFTGTCSHWLRQHNRLHTAFFPSKHAKSTSLAKILLRMLRIQSSE